MNSSQCSIVKQTKLYILPFFLFFLLQAPPLWAQNELLKTRISIHIEQIPLSEALLFIGEKSGTSISYASSQLPVDRPVSIKAENQSLESILQKILGTDLHRLLVKGRQISIQVSADSNSLRGKVSTTDSLPVSGATILLDNKSVGRTDENGIFTVTNVAPGAHEIGVFSIGYQAQRKSIQLRDDQHPFIHFTLDVDNQQLQTVEVTGRKESSYRNSTTFSGTKTQMSIKEIPQAISYVTKETIEDQLAFKVNEAIKNVSGISQSTSNNRNYVIRGFEATSKLINGQRVVTEIRSQTMLPNIERIEVLKGPSSALYANTDPGGTINLVTKKPLDESRKSINFATGSYNTSRISADFTGPMNEDKTLLYRLNLAYQDAESFRALQGGKYSVIAPSFSFLPNDRTRVNVELVYQMNNTKFDRGQPIFGASNQEDLYSTPVSFAIGKRNDFAKELFMTSSISLEHRFNKYITFNAAYLRSMYDEDLLEHRTANGYGVDADGNEIPTLVAMQTYRRQAKNYIDNISGYFNITARTGILDHTIVVGYDRIQEVFPLHNSTVRARGYLSADGTTTYSSYDPSKRERYLIVDNMPVPNVPHFDLKNPDYSIASIDDYLVSPVDPNPSKYFLNGIYLQDQIRMGKMQLLVGLRRDYYTDILNYASEDAENITQNAFIPRAGLVYTPNETLSIYGNFSEGYQPQTASIVGNPALYGGPFDPLTSRIFEIGAKIDFFQKNLAINTSIYQITQHNVLINAFDNANPDLLRQIGQQRARGVEMDIYGNLAKNLTLTAAFSYNVAKITESDITEDIGQLMPNAPKSQGNIWAKYLIDRGRLSGLGLALGANYATERNMTNMGPIKLPSYIVASAAAYYQISKFKITATLNNLFNETYWVAGENFTRLFPGTPRNYLIGIGYTF